jgi:hypothetical protein
MLKVKVTQNDINELLTNPVESYIINIETYRDALNSIADKLIPVKGLYLNNSYKPLIEFNTNYYVIKDNAYKLITDIDDIKTTKSNIYIKSNGVYELIYRYDKLKKNMSILTITPTINYSHILVLKEMIDAIITGLLHYKTYSAHYKLYNCFKEEYRDFVRNEDYLTIFNDLYSDISEFVSDNRWNIYFTKIINNSILIEKSVDYRIYQWTLGQIEDNDED